MHRTVAYIIRNEFYNGKIIWNKTDHATRKIKAKSEWIVSDGTYETFIPEELFNAAQERDKSTYRPKRKRPSSTYKHWLSGMLVCSACGQRLVRSSTTKKGNTYFQCTGFNHAFCSESHATNEFALKPAIFEGLDKVIAIGEVTYTVSSSNTEDNNEKKSLKINLVDFI